MLRVGLTGGIGSGKSAVSRTFESLGVPVSDADVIAHRITHDHHPILDVVKEQFGPQAVTDDGALDRDTMRQLVFDDAEQRKRLEAILHPVIRETMATEVATFNGPYCVLVIPLLIEGDKHPLVDRILVVDADDDRRIEWITQRSGLTEERIRSIFAAQASREQRLEVADDVIANDGSLEKLQQETARMHQRYLELAGGSA